MTCGA